MIKSHINFSVSIFSPHLLTGTVTDPRVVFKQLLVYFFFAFLQFHLYGENYSLFYLVHVFVTYFHRNR